MTELTFVEDTHTYRVGDRVVPSVTQIMRATDEKDVYADIPEHVLKRAGEIGTNVHKAVELYHTESAMLSSDDDSAAAYLDGYSEFLRDGVFRFEESEQRFYCECHWFAGTVDLFGTVAGEPAVLDLKTTSSAMPDKWELQTAAYAHLYGLAKDIDPPERYVVHLKKSGTYSLVHLDDPLAWHRFAARVKTYYAEE